VKGTAAMRRRQLRIGRVLDCFSLPLQCAGACCACIRAPGDGDDEAAAVEREALVASDRRQQLQQEQGQVLRLRDLVDGSRTLGFHLQPKVPVLHRHESCSMCHCCLQLHHCLLILLTDLSRSCYMLDVMKRRWS
jgi:hypothetical protein